MRAMKSAALLFASCGENLRHSSPPSASKPNSAFGVMECEYLKALSGDGDFIEKYTNAALASSSYVTLLDLPDSGLRGLKGLTALARLKSALPINSIPRIQRPA